MAALVGVFAGGLALWRASRPNPVPVAPAAALGEGVSYRLELDHHQRMSLGLGDEPMAARTRLVGELVVAPAGRRDGHVLTAISVAAIDDLAVELSGRDLGGGLRTGLVGATALLERDGDGALIALHLPEQAPSGVQNLLRMVA